MYYNVHQEVETVKTNTFHGTKRNEVCQLFFFSNNSELKGNNINDLLAAPVMCSTNWSQQLSGVNFIKKKLSKKSYPQVSDIKNIIQKFYPKKSLSKIYATYSTSLYVTNCYTWLYIIISRWKCTQLILRNFIWKIFILRDLFVWITLTLQFG